MNDINLKKGDHVFVCVDDLHERWRPAEILSVVKRPWWSESVAFFMIRYLDTDGKSNVDYDCVPEFRIRKEL